MKTIKVKPLGFLAYLADMLMVPVMYLCSGAFFERPQRTHRWNNRRLSEEEVKSLNPVLMENCDAVETVKKRGVVRFHIPLLGGWRQYVVIEPLIDSEQEWHIGWVTDDVQGVSRVMLKGPVRVLLGPAKVSFFGISATDNHQISVLRVGTGRVGAGGKYAKTPLL